MKFIPHDYQQYAIEYIETHEVAAVLLDMGFGKAGIPSIKSALNTVEYCTLSRYRSPNFSHDSRNFCHDTIFFSSVS